MQKLKLASKKTLSVESVPFLASVAQKDMYPTLVKKVFLECRHLAFKYLLSACLVVPTSGALLRVYQWEKNSLEQSLSKVIAHCCSSAANEKMHTDSVTPSQQGTLDAVEMSFSSCQRWHRLCCLMTIL